jgi:hypothetical protein
VQTFAAAVRAGVSGAVRDAVGESADAMPPPTPSVQWAAKEVVEGMQAFLHSTWGPNLLAYTSGGGIENVGVSRAVNEMLLSADQGVLQLFPAWPVAHPASFTTLRAKGGFLVSAGYGLAKTRAHRPGHTPLNTPFAVRSPVTLQSTVDGSRCRVLDPWPPGPARTKAFSSASVVRITPPVQVVPSIWVPLAALQGQYVLEFNTSAGAEYELRL